MSDVNTEVMASPSCRRGLKVMMWGFLFFLPLPILLKERPDVIAWAILLVGLYPLLGLHPAMRRLSVVAAIGMALWVPRMVVANLHAEAGHSISLLLYAATWVVVFVFVWRLCDVIARMAARTGADSVAASAQLRRWLPLMPLLMVAASPLVPANLMLVASLVFALATACVLSLLIGLMASTARMCEHPATAEGEDLKEADTADL